MKKTTKTAQPENLTLSSIDADPTEVDGNIMKCPDSSFSIQKLGWVWEAGDFLSKLLPYFESSWVVVSIFVFSTFHGEMIQFGMFQMVWNHQLFKVVLKSTTHQQRMIGSEGWSSFLFRRKNPYKGTWSRWWLDTWNNLK